MWPVQRSRERQKRGPQSAESAEASWVADIWTVPAG